MKKIIMILMLTGFTAPTQAGILTNLPTLVLAPFAGPCTDCNMELQSVMVSNLETSGWLENLIGPNANHALKGGHYVAFAQALYQQFNLELLNPQPRLKRR
jgi:hypothetical protein